MSNFPLKDISREAWQKKVNCTSMYTIPAEDEAFPVLQQLNQILTRLLELPIQQTLDQSLMQYFFTNVFPTVCQKIIRSRYFKNPEVLKMSNFVLQKSVYLVPQYIDYAIKHPRFLQILTTVFSDEFYFKHNNQMSYMLYPYSYYSQSLNQVPIQQGTFVDVIKIGHLYEKVTWSQGQVTQFDQYEVEIAYLYDGIDKKIKIKRDSPQIAVFKTKSKTFQWRMGLKAGDLVDVEDSFGSWYNATVLDVIDKGQGKKNVKVTLKIYNQLGPKEDENGSYYGFSQYQQILDITSPKLAPFCTVAKQYCYQSSKAAAYDAVEDLNDYQFPQINEEKIYALPRRKHLSQFQFQTINQFGRRGGFQKYLQYLQKQVNFDVLCYFVKGISGVAPYLHRELVKNLIQKIKDLFEKYLFGNTQKTTKTFTKQQSEMTFSGLKALQKRIYSNQFVSKYQNTLKMKLADICLQSEAIKNKLLGLNELKDIVRSVTYSNQKNKYIRLWVKNNKIFQKIYIINSHVQLIKKSQQFFKYLINENILQVTDLERLYKMAQKGDFQSRVSLYKLFQQVSHIFKKQHVEFLIDTILQSELNLILNEDIDLLHELSRFSNYFPLQKVIKFFENIILGENKVKQLNDYAIKRYSQIVAKNTDVKPYRRSIIKNFLQKLLTHDVSQVTKVLKGIFQGICVGDWQKKDLNEILSEEKVDQVVIQTLKKYIGQNQFSRVVSILEDFLLFIYKLSHKIKVNIKILDDFWALVQGNDEKQKQFYRWANQISKLDQGFQSANVQQLEGFYRKIFTPESIPDLQGSQFELAKNFFVQINKKLRYISVTNTFKDRQMQKQYRRKVDMKTLKLIDIIIQMVYFIKSDTINHQVLNFFIQLYTSKDNTQSQIDQFLTKLLTDFKTQYESKNYHMLVQTIKLIQVIINDSQKNVETKINSLLSKKQSDSAKFIIINQVSYISSDNLKKKDLILSMNTPIIKLRKILGKQFNMIWQQVKIVSHKQITDYDNSRTLKQIKLNPNQPLTISRRSTSSVSQQQLILNDKMNPKAIRCFKVIFQKYSTNGKMDKNQCNSFTTICLGSNCSTKYYNQKITTLYNKYDDDNDGLLTFQNFILFYEDAAKDRPSTVWSNLKSFDVKGDFKFKNQPDQLVQVSRYPRNIIAEYPNVYDILFDLLHVKEVASVAFELLERLPVSKTIQQQLLNIETVKDLQRILQTPDLYQLFYKLNILEYLAHSTQLETVAQKNWHYKFIELNGYEILYNCIFTIVNKSLKQNQQKQSQQIQDIVRQIFQTGLNLFNEYWIQCFSADPTKIRLSLTFISADQDMEQKMDYLIFGKFFRSQRKLEPKPSKLPKKNILYIWKSKSKKQIATFLTKQLENKWIQIGNTNKSPEQSEKRYSLTMLINKLIDSLNILCINQDPYQIANIIPTLLDKIPSIDLIKSFYYFVLSQCFFSKETKYQGIYIRELFKNLTKGTITSEHFRVLAMLVSRFGIQSMSDQGESQQTTKKLKQVLFENVLNNNNQLTVQGCAKLLTNFNLQQTPYETFQKVWQQRLFNPSTLNQKQQPKIALYDLILKICDSNPLIINKIIEKVLQTLNRQLKNMKIVYCNQFKQRSSTGYSGLKNLGSTCYINSMVQQLFMNKNFRYCILRADDEQAPNVIEAIDNKNQVRTVDDNFLHQLQRIFANLQITNRIDFAPRDFCVAYKPFGQSVNVLIQQDVQQFVSMFFERLQAGLSKTIFKKLVSDFYTGKTTNLFKCHSCQKTKKVEQTFHSISLQVKTSKTLAQSFTRFCHGEMINDYTCQFCNNKVDVTKKTRISSPPKMLIIHLQRIVFSLDTFINEKITTKHSFPNNFNLFQSTLEYYQLSQTGANIPTQQPAQYNYNLIGIICHSGTAQSGHYISYIKTSENKWIQFNDSLVTSFNPSNIQSQCFGGSYAAASYDDDYYQQKKQSSKSAYLLIYEKQGQNTIQIILNKKLQSCKDQKQTKKLKQQILNTLDLKQVVIKIQKQGDGGMQGAQKVSQNQNTDNATPIVGQSHQQSSSAPQDSQKQTKLLLQQKQLQIRRHQSQDNIQTQPADIIKQQQPNKTMIQIPKQASKDQITYIQDPVSPYLPHKLKQQIQKDNEVHFFEKCLSSASFVKFFSLLISKPNDLYKEILPICQKLTFGFWLKSPSFKDLLNMLDGILRIYPAGFDNIVTNNPAIINLLIQSSDSQIRTSMANFLSKVISETIQVKKIKISTNNDDPIFKFLDNLFSLLPSTVSRCWTKFGQYFEFWYELSNKGQTLVQYMIDREIVKHFMDYFLDTKSPLKIYATKREHPIGSSYANPNFSMLLKCVFSLLQQRMVLNQKNKITSKSVLSFSPDQQKLLMSCESLQKLIADNYENIAAQLVKQICPNNLPASQKAALVLLKGISKSNSESIQPYLQVLHQFVLIDDQYQDLRIKWVIGKQTLAVSNLSLKIIGLNSYSLSQKIYNFDSSINLQSGSSLLDPILTYHNRIQTFALLCTKQVFRLCDVNRKIRKLIFSLESPTLVNAKFVDFLKGFIEKYNQQHKKSYGYYSTTSPGFNRQQFGKQVKQLFDRVVKKLQDDNAQQYKQQEKQKVSEPQPKIMKQSNATQTKVQNSQSNNPQPQKQTKQQIKSDSDEQTYLTLNQKPQKKNKTQTQPQSVVIQFVQVPQLSSGNSDIPQSISKKVSNDSDHLDNNAAIRHQIIQDSDYPSLLDNNKNYQENVYYSTTGYDQDDGWEKLDMEAIKDTPVNQTTSQRGNRSKVKHAPYNINVNVENRAQYSTQMNLTDQQDEQPLMKTKQPQVEKVEKQQKKPIVNDYTECWHPVKFQYTPIRTLEPTPNLSNIKIEQHQSIVTYVLTKPTGSTNRSFTSMSGSSKIYQRINEEVWKNQKLVKVHGFFMKNNGRESVRILTDDGCAYCKSGDNLFIWADSIKKVWECDRSFQWPKWSMFDQNTMKKK